MANFNLAFQITDGHEGGYVNDPNDNGGETYRGIARKFWPNWQGWRIIDDYKFKHKLIKGQIIDDPSLNNQVRAFYKSHFWDINKLDSIVDQGIANEIYDTGVNMGIKIAAIFLQQGLNLLNRNQKYYQDIKEDGSIGPVTISMTNAHKYPRCLEKTLNILQGARYVEICKNNPSQETFFRGWLTRVKI